MTRHTAFLTAGAIGILLFALGFGSGYGTKWYNDSRLAHPLAASNSVTPPRDTSTPDTINGCSYDSINTDTLLVELNDYRLSHNLKQLLSDSVLQEYAGKRATEIDVLDAYTHDSTYGDFSQWAKKNHKLPSLKITSEAEDLVNHEKDPCKAIQDLAASPSHNDTLLSSNAIIIGVGYENGIVVFEIGNR